jgi:hypothetical protein
MSRNPFVLDLAEELIAFAESTGRRRGLSADEVIEALGVAAIGKAVDGAVAGLEFASVFALLHQIQADAPHLIAGKREGCRG